MTSTILERSRRDFIQACTKLRSTLQKRLVDSTTTTMMLDDTQLSTINEAVDYYVLAMAGGDKTAQLAIRAAAIEDFEQELDRYAVPPDEITPLVKLLIDCLDTAATLGATAREESAPNAAPKPARGSEA